MSWLSKHVFSKLKKLTVGRAVQAFVPGGGTLVAAYDSLKHAAQTGKEQADRIAREQGVSELEAYAILANRAAGGFEGQNFIERNKSTITIALAVGVVILIIVMARRK